MANLVEFQVSPNIVSCSLRLGFRVGQVVVGSSLAGAEEIKERFSLLLPRLFSSWLCAVHCCIAEEERQIVEVVHNINDIQIYGEREKGKQLLQKIILSGKAAASLFEGKNLPFFLIVPAPWSPSGVMISVIHRVCLTSVPLCLLCSGESDHLWVFWTSWPVCLSVRQVRLLHALDIRACWA